jgi:thioredoxin reductase (NADPH)
VAKPAIFTVDDDPNVLQSIGRDLRHEYGGRFRLLQADSGQSALEAIRNLKLRGEAVALFLVDQRMPEMTGVEFLAEAIQIFPDAKRVLLTAYTDIEAAIRAINDVGIHHYLLKPWHPPEERLYPVLNDLLDDWLSAYRAPFEGLRVIGYRWAPASHEVRQFLSLNQVPFHWMDVTHSTEAQRLLEQTGLEHPQFPVVIFPDGSVLDRPSTSTIAERIGLSMHAQRPFYDLAIIGAGPSGLAAGVYAASEGLRTVLIEKQAPGGQAATSARIENYLGFPVGLSGADLARRATAQARRFGAEILSPVEAVGIRIEGQYRIVTLSDGREISCHALLIATGVTYRMLEVPGVNELTGAGVYYGATMSEAPAYEGQDLFIVGAGNSAGQAAVYFSQHARQVTLLVRGSTLATSMSRYLIDQLEAIPNVRVMTETRIAEAHGSDHLEAIAVEQNGHREVYPADALFVFIGATPPTDWICGVVECDPQGFIMCGAYLEGGMARPSKWPLDRDPYMFETSVPGIFVTGDVRHGSVKRIATAVGEGAMVVQFVHQYLGNL